MPRGVGNGKWSYMATVIEGFAYRIASGEYLSWGFSTRRHLPSDEPAVLVVCQHAGEAGDVKAHLTRPVDTPTPGKLNLPI